MQIDRSVLDAARARDIITTDQADALWRFLQEREPADHTAVARFRAAHILYYFGGALALAAASLLLNLGWEQLGPLAGFLIPLAYAIGCWLVAAWFLDEQRLPIPAGILAAICVACTPLAIYGFQQLVGWWPTDHYGYRDYHRWIDWHWWFMELGTLAVGAVVFWRFRLPFLILPIAITLWYIGMDIAAIVTGGEADWELSRQYTLLFGLAMMLFALAVDLRQRGPLDHAFWLYLFGLAGFWGALTATSSDSELARFLYFCTNLGLIAAAVLLSRRTFVVFGAMGVALYLGHLAMDLFVDSLAFPFVLTLIGLAVIGAGVYWQRNEARIEASLRPLLPPILRRAVERRHA